MYVLPLAFVEILFANFVGLTLLFSVCYKSNSCFYYFYLLDFLFWHIHSICSPRAIWNLYGASNVDSIWHADFDHLLFVYTPRPALIFLLLFWFPFHSHSYILFLASLIQMLIVWEPILSFYGPRISHKALFFCFLLNCSFCVVTALWTPIWEYLNSFIEWTPES